VGGPGGARGGGGAGAGRAVRRRPRQHGGDPRRPVPGVDDRGPRGAGARRRHLRDLPDERARRGALSPRARRRARGDRRGPGAPRQDAGGARRRSRCARRDRRRHPRAVHVPEHPRAPVRRHRGRRSRPGPGRRPRSAGRGRAAGRRGDHRLHVGHDRPSEGRALPPRPAPRRVREHPGPLSDPDRRRASGRRDAAAVPHDGAQHGHHDAAAGRHRPALSGEPRDRRGEPVRGGSDVRVHRAAISAEIRGAPPGRHRRLDHPQARGVSRGAAARSPGGIEGRHGFAGARRARGGSPAGSCSAGCWRRSASRGCGC